MTRADTLQWLPVVQLDAAYAYKHHVCVGKPSCALSLLALWERPWSTQALRFAAHALATARAAGLVVLGD